MTREDARPPLLLIPGLDGTGLLFYRQIPELSKDYGVATVRLPDSARDMPELIAHVDRAVDALTDSDGSKVTLVGESFGGALSLSYALAHADRVERLVILNSFPYFSPQLRLWLGLTLLRAVPWGAMALVRRLTAWRLHSRHTGREELRRFHQLMQATTRDGYVSRLSILREYDVRAHLPTLSVPTLFLASDADHLVPSVEQARLMTSLVPGATMKVLEGHGHICLLAPDMNLADILADWTPANA
ncbi:MAG: alpha/beta hydrolase [Acidobacteriota bacterium]